MHTVLQIEHRASMLSARKSILEPLGYGVISVLGFSNAIDPLLLKRKFEVIVIGHGFSRLDRREIISHFRTAAPYTPIVCLLRGRDHGFDGADYNCLGDNPPLWIRTVIRAAAEGRKLKAVKGFSAAYVS